MEEQLLTLFGVTVEQLVLVTGVVLLAVEYLKREFPEKITGWTTRIVALVVAFAISTKLLYPNWEGIATLTIAAFILPSGIKSLVKKGGKEKPE